MEQSFEPRGTNPFVHLRNSPNGTLPPKCPMEGEPATSTAVAVWRLGRAGPAATKRRTTSAPGPFSLRRHGSRVGAQGTRDRHHQKKRAGRKMRGVSSAPKEIEPILATPAAPCLGTDQAEIKGKKKSVPRIHPITNFRKNDKMIEIYWQKTGQHLGKWVLAALGYRLPT